MSPAQLHMTLALSACTLSVVIGLFVWLKNPKAPVNRYFGYYNIAVGVWNIGDFFALYLPDHSIALLMYRLTGIGGILFIGFYARFYCALAGDITPPKAIRVTINAMTGILVPLMISPLVISDIEVGQSGFTEVDGPAFLVFGLYLVWGVLYGISRVFGSYRSAQGAKRRQLQYILASFGFVCVAVISYSLWNLSVVSDAPPLYFGFEMGYSLLMAYAILQYGALDIKTAIHKTTLWLVTSSAAVIPVAAAFWWLLPMLREHPILRGIVLAAGGLSLLVYARTVQPFVDHRFQRRRYDIYRMIQNLGEELVVLKEVDEVSQKVVSTIEQILYSSHTFVTVFDQGLPRSTFPQTSGQRHISTELLCWLAQHNDLIYRKSYSRDPRLADLRGEIVEYLDSMQAEFLVPFVKDGVLLGLLHVGLKKTLGSFTPLDIEFLNLLRTEVTVAYHNSLLYENMTSLSKQLEQWNAELEEKIQDRTQELEGAYNQLKDLDQAKTQFFATVSHELRTPLTLILAPLESLLKGEAGPISDGVKRHATLMHQNGLRLLKQINNLLDLTRLDAGGMRLEFRRGDLEAFFRGLVASVAPMAERKRIDLVGQAESELPPRVYFDRERLEKVVLNLLFNAIKFTDSGGRVTLTWGRSADGQLRVQVADSGIGIAKRDLPKLFKRFSQVDGSTNRRYEGTGIGLALAKEIVELHGGWIGVESELGRGSTLTFSIPLLLEAPRQVTEEETAGQPQCDSAESADWTQELRVAAERQEVGVVVEPTVTAEPSLSPANGCQALIVEDNPDMREFIAFELQGDYRVLKAANGVEGVRVAAEHVPDVIISDVMMPEMDGYQLCREIRKDARIMHIPIILLTARADMAMKIEGLEHGADDYLTKPFNAQELRAKIKALLEQRRLEREIQQRNEALEAALTELKSAQTQLVQSEKMAGLGLLVAGMAHEINNPINFAKNSLNVLQRAWEELKPQLGPDPMSADTVEAVEDMDASLGIVKSGVARTEQIVGQLKSFVRKDDNQKITCSVREGLESTLELIRPMMGRQIILHVDLQSSGRVFAVPGKLNQVWMNLLQNAVQAVGSSGDIWVESRDHEHMITVAVRDAGPGISPEHLPRLFEPFFTTKPVGQGTGLGLSVSYQIVQDVGGRIDVKSKSGQGAEFTVVLPLAKDLSQAA